MTPALRPLYYVTGWHRPSNQWWRFAVTASSQGQAVLAVAEAHDQLTRVHAVRVCDTPDEIFQEL